MYIPSISPNFVTGHIPCPTHPHLLRLWPGNVSPTVDIVEFIVGSHKITTVYTDYVHRLMMSTPW